MARGVSRRRNRAECVVLGGGRRSGHSGDARNRHRRRANHRSQAWSGAVRIRRVAARPSAIARARREGRRAGARATSESSPMPPVTRASPRSSSALGAQFASADVKILNDGVFPFLAATLAQRPATNLLQGPYAPKSNWIALTKPWRLAASLVAASVALSLLLQGAEYWQLTSCRRSTRRGRRAGVSARRRRLEHVGLSA